MKSLSPHSLVAAAIGVLALTLGVCGGPTPENSSGGTDDKLTRLTVGASLVPHAKTPKYLEDFDETKKAGLKFNVKDFNDRVLSNEALAGGGIDTNYCQMVSYLEDQSRSRSYEFTAGEGIHLEPLAIFSKKVKGLKEVRGGATISIINNPTNQDRPLALLAANDLLKLKGTDVSMLQIKDNPKTDPYGFKLHEVGDPSLVTSLLGVDLSVINGNFYQSVGLGPSKVLATESPKDNPAVNILVWRADEENKLKAIKELGGPLHSNVTKKYIE